MRRCLIRVVVCVLVAWVLLVAWGLVFAWRRAPTMAVSHATAVPTFMPMSEYGQVADTHERPYIVTIEGSSGGAVVLFGAEHTRDPDDPQLAQIDQMWDRLDPTVALVESRLGILFPGFMDPVKTFGEPGHVAALARRDGARLCSWEPEKDRLNATLIERFGRERVALLVVLRPYFSNLRFGRPAEPEAFVEEYRAKRTRWAGLESTFESVGAIDRYWSELFPDGPDWRDVSDQWGLPSPLDEIAAAGNDLRDEHLARAVIELVGRGERVFVVAGSSHAVRLEGVLRGVLSRDLVQDER